MHLVNSMNDNVKNHTNFSDFLKIKINSLRAHLFLKLFFDNFNEIGVVDTIRFKKIGET